LLAAMRTVLERAPQARFELDVIAGLAFSDPAQVSAIRAAIDGWPGEFDERIALRLHGNATEELKQRVLADADLFVLPTRHEGFCVPIVEALGHGCKVITYANSNTPAICGGHASLVPTADTTALAYAMLENIAQIAAPAWQEGLYDAYSTATWNYVQQFAPTRIREQWRHLIAMQASMVA
jgi:glycosyltransferase involved in cell wall biosynthesis